MKKLNLLFVALIGASALTFTSCTDECKDVVCENGGTCDEETGACDCPTNFYGESCETECVNGTYANGSCGCEEGYEGAACTVVSSDKFIATYNLIDDCFTGEYTATITRSSNNGNANVLLDGFGAYLCNGEAPTVNATVSGSDITIPEQSFCDGANAFTLQGIGTINGSELVITVNYSGQTPGGLDTYNCTSTLTKI